MEMHINMTAVLLAVLANFVLGFLWYTPLFGKTWAVENKLDTTVKPTFGQMAKGMSLMVVGNFLMAYVFAHNIAAWSYVPGNQEASLAGNLMSSAIFTWLGFYVPVDIGVVTWEGKSWKLFFINTGYHLAMLFVAAAILLTMN